VRGEVRQLGFPDAGQAVHTANRTDGRVPRCRMGENLLNHGVNFRLAPDKVRRDGAELVQAACGVARRLLEDVLDVDVAPRLRVVNRDGPRSGGGAGG
jgi:hypothetical protein